MRDMHDDTLGVIETEIAFLMRLGEATRRSTGIAPHRALDRAAYVILRHLQEGPQTVTALADRLNLDGSTVTRQVAVLERDGLVAREPDPRDGRSNHIAATPAGLKSVEQVRAARRDLYGRILDDWPEPDRAQLAAALGRLNEALQAHVRRR
jgi:DNA-binding MarR family transcriptional regulator